MPEPTAVTLCETEVERLARALGVVLEDGDTDGIAVEESQGADVKLTDALMLAARECE